MPIFQVSSRTVKAPGLPKMRTTGVLWWQYLILRYTIGSLIIGMLVILLSRIGLSFLFFLLLPVVMGFITTRSQLVRGCVATTTQRVPIASRTAGGAPPSSPAGGI